MGEGGGVVSLGLGNSLEEVRTNHALPDETNDLSDSSFSIVPKYVIIIVFGTTGDEIQAYTNENCSRLVLRNTSTPPHFRIVEWREHIFLPSRTSTRST